MICMSERKYMKSIQTQAIITSLSSKQYGSLGLRVATPELSTQEKALFMELQGINLEIKITPKDEQVVPEYKVDKEIQQKHPSARLRAVIWRVWEQDGSQGDFDIYYKNSMENIIEHYKEKLI